MATVYKDKLSTRLFSPLIIIFILIFIVLSFYVPSITKDNAIKSAIISAESPLNNTRLLGGITLKML